MAGPKESARTKRGPTAPRARSAPPTPSTSKESTGKKARKTPASSPTAAPALTPTRPATGAPAPRTPRAAAAAPTRKRPARRRSRGAAEAPQSPKAAIKVRRMEREDIDAAWAFLKLTFRDVNRETVEYQRPRSKQRFVEQYDDEGIEQLLFEVEGDVVGYAECAFEVTGSDNWINPRYFDSRDMRPLFVEELASHPSYQGRGVGSFMLEQLEHLARVRGCTHMVLEVAENNRSALEFYRKRAFQKLDAAIFMAKKVDSEPELLPPRPLKELGPPRERDTGEDPDGGG